jgi:hypothetical protein
MFFSLTNSKLSLEISPYFKPDFTGWYTIDSEFLSSDYIYEESDFVGELLMLQARIDWTYKKG